MGISRVLKIDPNGSAFLQKAAGTPLTMPGDSSFFEALSSGRRLLHSQIADVVLERHTGCTLSDPFESFPALKKFYHACVHGHSHAAAVHNSHDPDSGTKYATGHVYPMDLRSQAMRHLDLCDPVGRVKERDLRLIKRPGADSLRAGAPA